MKKSWIIVLAFVFLWSAVPAFSVPVPSELCLGNSSESGFFRLLPESKGKIGDAEFFDMVGWWLSMEFDAVSLIQGSAHRVGKKKLHLSLTGAFDGGGGPGGGGSVVQTSYDVSYHLKKKKGTLSYLYDWVGVDLEGTASLTTLDCSDLDEAGYSKPVW